MKKRCLVLLLALLFCLGLPVTASANGLESPCLTVLVPHPTWKLSLTLEFDAGTSLKPLVLTREGKVWEVYYRFRYYDLRGARSYGSESLEGAQLLVDTGSETYSIPVDPEGFTTYDNLVTLDLLGRRLIYGQPWWRQPLLVLLRVGLTLLLEGAVFYLWGYRQKRSWVVFLVVNLITQGAVNVTVQVLFPAAVEVYRGMVLGIFFYTPIEVGVLLVEMIAFGLLLKERGGGRGVGCAAAANLVSWALGGWLILSLPM
ncbi:MAG: hypothetical protein ACOYJZ_01575 [Acutalibacter sp.]|jgi:hypothetical protein